MYDEQLIIDRLLAQTPYTDIRLGQPNENKILTDESALPIIYVGHTGIVLHNSNNLWRNGFSELENDQMLLTSIQYICSRSNWIDVRINIFNALKTFTPFVGDASQEYSYLVFIEANKVAEMGEKSWWQEVYGLIFPQLS